METKYENKIRREMRKSNIKKSLSEIAVSFGILTGIAASAAFVMDFNKKKYDEQMKIIEGYNSTKIISIEKGDTYWDYAKRLMREYPQLMGLNVNELIEEIQELNENKELNYSDSVELPVYDFSKKAEKK